MSPPNIGQTLTLTIERLGCNGEGVARLDGYTLFVDRALPGEQVLAVLQERHATYGRAQLLSVLEPSPHRVAPVCPYFARCGGCQLMHLDYGQQLVAKRQQVVDALERIGKLQNVQVLPCEPSPQPLHYRNKIQLPEGRGLYAPNSHDIVDVDRCAIHCDLGEEILQRIRPLLQGVPLTHLLLKTAPNSRQSLVVLITRGPVALQEVSQQIMAAAPEIRGVVHHINRSSGNAVLHGEFKLLAGEPAIEEELLGLHFRISPAAFFQVNTSQASQLYTQALQYAALTGSEVVLDGYCGVGALSLLAARQAGKVIGIECVGPAIDDARYNAQRNGLTNVRFVCGLVERSIGELQQVDVALLNPARKGCEPEVLERLVVLAPKRIVYISCNPATLARDAARLTGYRLAEVRPFDMFPHTAHVECCALFDCNN